MISDIDKLAKVDITWVLNVFIDFLEKMLSIPIMMHYCILILLVGVFYLLRRFFRLWR
jgi:hypothetical protein